jgi:hypothetical protein
LGIELGRRCDGDRVRGFRSYGGILASRPSRAVLAGSGERSPTHSRPPRRRSAASRQSGFRHGVLASSATEFLHNAFVGGAIREPGCPAPGFLAERLRRRSLRKDSGVNGTPGRLLRGPRSLSATRGGIRQEVGAGTGARRGSSGCELGVGARGGILAAAFSRRHSRGASYLSGARPRNRRRAPPLPARPFGHSGLDEAVSRRS